MWHFLKAFLFLKKSFFAAWKTVDMQSENSSCSVWAEMYQKDSDKRTEGALWLMRIICMKKNEK